MIALGAFHGLNPGMGWLFALSLGLQQHSGRVIWISLFPIAIGHAAAIVAVVLIVLAGLQVISFHRLQWLTAVLLLGFGIYKLFNYYRHPRWVGMKVGMRDLLLWSFLMATAHGAGLMVIPALLGVAAEQKSHHAGGHPAMPEGGAMLLAVGAHTLSMLLVMGAVAWIVYRKLGLSVLRQKWINFDLIWAVALLVVGGVALWMAI
ncbi:MULTISPECIES: hypothetical protein [unclassified Microbulbifer]|uniref:hypothetical protein n=1 Tax=unclassified Microbulbifer TaxID=2619833 RepID=UPI0027E537C7|nr:MULTISPECIES: hypothetical protein [unclassified Microbulbifer]